MIIQSFQSYQDGFVLGGRYRIIDVLGQGGMSTVYLAEDMKLPGKKWAVKQTRHNNTELRLLQAEVSVLLNLNHPQLPHIVDFYPPDRDGSSYLVMEYIEGETLQQHFERHGNRLPAERIIDCCLQICDLLQYLHGLQPAPVVYRDLKPSNIMIDRQGTVRLIDFGIARSYKPGKASDTVPLGTVAFAAPELLEREQTDPRADLYSLGAMMYYLFSGGTYYVVSRQPLPQLCPDLPERIAEIVHRLLEPKPERRYQSAVQVRNELASCSPTGSFSQAVGVAGSQTPYASFLPRKRIVIGGLYAGAGATFTTVALAKVLDQCAVPHAVVEGPVREPELHGLLCGGRHSDRSMHKFYNDPDKSAGEKKRTVGWKQGYTIWYPLNPETIHPAEAADRLCKVVYSVEEPIVFIDISDRWLEPCVQELCRTADHIVAVVDPFPAKWMNGKTVRILEVLSTWKEEGRSVHWVANQDAGQAGRKEWLGSVPERPLCTLPHISHDEKLAAVHAGRPVQDMPEAKRKLISALEPVLQLIVPAAAIRPNAGKGRGLFSKWRK